MRISGFLPWPVALLAAVLCHTAHAQSFDCGKAETDTEWAICNTTELGKLDGDLAKTYSQLLDSAAEGSALRKKFEQLQTSWIHGSRDLCGGDVSCLIQAYNTISAALPALSPDSPANPAQQPPGHPVVPDCSALAGAQKDLDPADQYNKTVCSDPKLLKTAEQIDRVARDLSAKLPASWKAAFDAQQSAFPGMPNMCPSDEGPKLKTCVATAVGQRLEDVSNLAAYIERTLPACTSSEITVKDSEVGDGGMSKSLEVYLLEYGGADACVVRGYPALSILDGKGDAQPGYAYYSGGTFFTNVPVPPLPVVLSPESRRAWFAIQTAGACDPSSGPFKVQVALPRSRYWLRTLEFPYATCSQIAVTPIAMISTLLSSVN